MAKKIFPGQAYPRIELNGDLSVNPNDVVLSESDKGVAGGIASLGIDGKVPSNQLPAGGSGDMLASVYGPIIDGKEPAKGTDDNYVTDTEKSNLHVPGSDKQDLSGKENVGVAASAVSSHAALTTGVHGVGAGTVAKTSDIPAAGSTPSTQAFGDSADGGAAATWSKNDHKHAMMATPTKTTVGLGNVDNTSDAGKPVSTATQTALDGKPALSLITAVSDFFVGSGVGAVVKKTLAEVKTLLGIATDIATHAALTATHGVATIAGLLSPAFTGTPTAPTASDGTSTTQIATTAFVMTSQRSAIGAADLAIANTETMVCQLTFAADELIAGSTFMFRAYATRVGATSAQCIARIRVGTTLLSGNIAAVVTSVASTLAVGTIIEGMVTVRTAGAGGTVLGSIGLETHLAAVTISKNIQPLASAVAVNTTTANIIIGLTFISGNAGNTFTFRNAIIWRAN